MSPTTIKVVVRREASRRESFVPIPSALARAQALAARDHLAFALTAGYEPDTMEARPRKGNGKPLGYDTGRLARGMRVRSAGATRLAAAYSIEPGSDRAMLTEARAEYGGLSFVERYNIITLDGVVQDVMSEAAAEYMRENR